MDVHFNLFVSNLQNNAISIPNSQLLLRLISNLTSDDTNYPPIVQKVKAFKDRNEAFSKELAKFIRKSKESLAELSKELDKVDDDPVLVAQLKEELNTNQVEIHNSLSKIEPTVTSQINTIKTLSDHIFPPTEELFRKKVLERLEKNKNQQVPTSKKLRCTICLDNDSDVIIKRTCKPPSNGIPTCEPPPSLANRNNSSSSSTYDPSSPPPPRNTFCEKASCNCGPVTCMECVIKHYWSSSGNGLKSYSTCPCCRAEFCTKDIYRVEYINDIEEKQKEDDPIKVDNKDSNNNIDNNTAATTTATTTTTNTTTSTSSTTASSSKKRKDDSDTSSDNKRFKEQKDTDRKSNTSFHSFQKLSKPSRITKRNEKLSQNKSLEHKTDSDDNSDDNTKDEKNDNDDDDDDNNNSNNNNNNNNNNNKNSNPFKRLISFWK
ncbi:hypothetical protein ACTA71_009225 [Dictyostelium dimigraforme]